MSNHNPTSYIDFFPFPVPLPFFSVGGQSVFCHCPLLTFVQGFLARRTLVVLCFHISSMWCSECCPSAAPAHCLEDLSDLRFHGIALQDGGVWPPECRLCTTALHAVPHAVIDIQGRILPLLSLWKNVLNHRNYFFFFLAWNNCS